MTRNSNLSYSSINNQSATPLISCDPDNYDQDHTTQGEEESGWTSYFDDFFSNKTPHPSSSKHLDDMVYDADEDHGISSYGGSGSSAVLSDAASCAAWSKSQYKDGDVRSSSRRADALEACSSFDGTQMVVIYKKLRFKKSIRHKKTSSDYYDDSLEDTASSPVNSPKTKGEVYGYDDEEGRQENGLKQQVVEVNKSLKEKGLCLVPYSMLLNYIT